MPILPGAEPPQRALGSHTATLRELIESVAASNGYGEPATPRATLPPPRQKNAPRGRADYRRVAFRRVWRSYTRMAGSAKSLSAHGAADFFRE